jgi:hypothetical protein
MNRIHSHFAALGTAACALFAAAPLASANVPNPTKAPTANFKAALAPPKVQPKAATIRRGHVTISLGCLSSGSVRASYGGERLGGARFRCAQNHATARVRIGRRTARRIHRDRSPRLSVTARVGKAAVTRSLRLGITRSERLRRGGRARAAALGSGSWMKGSCNGYNAQWSAIGMLNSTLAGGDTYWLRFRMYQDRVGFLTNWTGWGIPNPVRDTSQGLSLVPGATLNMPRGKWIAVEMQIWSYRQGGVITDKYLSAEDAGLADLYGGIWCKTRI